LDKITQAMKKNLKLFASIVFILLIAYAWINRFIQDDAFISFRYAKNFVNGWGLVFNRGERVEGYTNFLWTLIISIPIKLGINPIIFSYIIGILFFILTLYFTFKLSNLIFGSRTISLLTVFLLGANYTMSCYATGGLETQMQTAIVVVSYYLFLKYFSQYSWKITTSMFLSILLAVSVLTRPDSLIFAAVILSALIFIRKKKEHSNKMLLENYFALLVPFIIIIAVYLIWKLDYYGNILPNTYYAKAAGQTSIISGLEYVGWFLTTYWLFIFLFILIICAREFFSLMNIKINILMFTILLWTLYIIKVGGDFMEFRFFVPIMPFIFIILIHIINKLIHPQKLKLAFVLLIFTGSFFHIFTFSYHSGIESVKLLSSHLIIPVENWIGVGKRLNDLFGKDDVKIATTAAGAIPYYSGLPTLDMLGLNDLHISRETNTVSPRPGHQKLASISYINKRNVNLLIGHPFVVDTAFKVHEISNQMFEEHFIYTIKDWRILNPKILVVPLDSDHNIIMLYLNQSTAVDNIINAGKIRVFPYSEIAGNG
jgi:arabinofuranosyltransferase